MGEMPVILVVDDDEDCRAVVADVLELSGYRVICSGEAHSAVEIARLNPPALVLLDFSMPDEDGGWVIRALRSAGGELGRVPVVLTTGALEAKELAASLGVRALEKPFDIARLLEVVRTLAPAAAAPP
jgi:CheY-like chemotaxis protein